MLLLAVLSAARGQIWAQTHDGEAFRQAKRLADPQQRLRALEEFCTAFPQSGYRPAALEALLKGYLGTSPAKVDAIHRTAAELIRTSAPGLERWAEEVHLASALATAGTGGLDLEDARMWAEDAVRATTEATYRRQLDVSRLRLRLPALPRSQVHREYAQDRAAALRALASVELRQDRAETASPLLKEAARLDPASPDLERLLGELALAQGQQGAALEHFLRANAVIPLPGMDRRAEERVFAIRNPDAGEAALESQLNRTYQQIFPPLYHLSPRRLPAGGHTALLELFTGSDCLPCAAADLAVDSLLTSYAPQDLLALEWDVPIPEADPLTASTSQDRAHQDAIESTPTAFLDGQPLQILGSRREDLQNVVVGFASAIEDTASLPSELQLSVSAYTVEQGAGTLIVQPKIQLRRAALPASARETTGAASLPALQQATVFVALVQDPVYYSGKNGVRVHRMVVRALHQVPAAALLAGDDQHALAPFDLQSIEQSLAETQAVQAQEAGADAPRLSSSEAKLDPSRLRLVAWVEDMRSRKVLQAASTSLDSAER